MTSSLSPASATTGEVAAACGLSRGRTLRTLEVLLLAGLVEHELRRDRSQAWRLTQRAARRLLQERGR